jgi:hypothetical protein
VTAVSKDGKTLTLELPTRERGEAPTQQEIKLNDKTSVIYFEIGAGGDQPTNGYMARIWLVDGSKDTAGKIFFRGNPQQNQTIVRGKVLGIGKDGKSLTLETPGKERTDPPINVDVKLTPKTKLMFHNVGPDGALLTEGYVAQAVMEEGSTDTAAHVTLSPAPAGGPARRERE